jgi:hypothetical protein
MRRIILIAGLALACSGCAYGPDYGYPGYGYYGGYGYSGYPAYGSYAYGYGLPYGYGYAPYWGPSLGVGVGVVGGHDNDHFRNFGNEHGFEERRFGENRGQASRPHGQAAPPVPHNAPGPRLASPAPHSATPAWRYLPRPGTAPNPGGKGLGGPG